MAAFAKLLVVQACTLLVSAENNGTQQHHHHHHHHGHHKKAAQQVTPPKGLAPPSGLLHAADVSSASAVKGTEASEQQIVAKIRGLEQDLANKKGKEKHASATKTSMAQGHLNVNGPLPVDFSERFAQGVAEATGCRADEVELLGAAHVPEAEGAGPIEEVMFRSNKKVVAQVEEQAADPGSKLARGRLHSFLVARDDEHASEEDEPEEESEAVPAEPCDPHASGAPEVDMAMPYGDLEPFGREDTAQELTESSVRESNAMVDQLERAEVAEEKRAVFRALTRLRGAAITSYDGIARSQTGNIDDYARTYQWRKVHPVHHLASEEGDVQKWAFPEDSQE